LAAALAGVDVSRYPDPDALELGEAIASREGVSLRSVAVGNGSSELIWALARAYLAPGDLALVCGPTYGEYAVASMATGAEVRAMRVLEKRWFFASVLEAARA